MTTKQGKRSTQVSQDARVYRALAELGVADHNAVGDDAGDSETNTFCTPQQALASLKRFQKMGLTQRSEEVNKGWTLTDLGWAIYEEVHS